MGAWWNRGLYVMGGGIGDFVYEWWNRVDFM